MTIAVYDVNGVSGNNSGSDKNITLTPTSVGHLMVIVVSKNDSNTPSGWTAVRNTQQARIYTKVATASGAQTATLSALGTYVLVAFCVSGSTGAATDSSTTFGSNGIPSAPSVNATKGGILVVGLSNTVYTDVISLPSGTTNLYANGTVASDRYFRACYLPVTTTGASGAITATQSTSTWYSAMMALDAAATIGGLFFGSNF
jgi:hypothetical protein